MSQPAHAQASRFLPAPRQAPFSPPTLLRLVCDSRREDKPRATPDRALPCVVLRPPRLDRRAPIPASKIAEIRAKAAAEELLQSAEEEEDEEEGEEEEAAAPRAAAAAPASAARSPAAKATAAPAPPRAAAPKKEEKVVYIDDEYSDSDDDGAGRESPASAKRGPDAHARPASPAAALTRHWPRLFALRRPRR